MIPQQDTGEQLTACPLYGSSSMGTLHGVRINTLRSETSILRPAFTAPRTGVPQLMRPYAPPRLLQGSPPRWRALGATLHL